MPRERLEPRFSRWRVMSVGVAASVTFAIESVVVIEKIVTRTGPLRMPASIADRRSGPSAGLERVRTLPTRKERYSSLSVGARNARYADAVKARRSLA